MKALICDICGGKLSVGSGGTTVCESCGMAYTRERVQEMIQDVRGTVQVDSSHLLDNFANMATQALKAKNYKEAEQYSNRILEIDPNRSAAWMLKGRAAAGQATTAKSRLDEVTLCCANAFKFAPDDRKVEYGREIVLFLNDFCPLIAESWAQFFAEHPHHNEAAELQNALAAIEKTIRAFKKQTGIDASIAVNRSAIRAYNCISDAVELLLTYDPDLDEDRIEFLEFKDSLIAFVGVYEKIAETASDIDARLKAHDNAITLLNGGIMRINKFKFLERLYADNRATVQDFQKAISIVQEKRAKIEQEQKRTN